MTFLDTSALAGAVLDEHPQHVSCRHALEHSNNPITDSHALAELFATLTGFYKVPTEAAAELVLGLEALVRIEPLLLEDYETAISGAPTRYYGWRDL
jgi:predicted nucleic acid-binding protein